MRAVTTERSDKGFPQGFVPGRPRSGLRSDRRHETVRARPPPEGLEVVGERLREVLLRPRAEHGATGLAALEEHHRRQREDAVAVGDRRGFSSMSSFTNSTPRIAAASSSSAGSIALHGPAPRRPEVDDDRLAAPAGPPVSKVSSVTVAHAGHASGAGAAAARARRPRARSPGSSSSARRCGRRT